MASFNETRALATENIIITLNPVTSMCARDEWRAKGVKEGGKEMMCVHKHRCADSYALFKWTELNKGIKEVL